MLPDRESYLLEEVAKLLECTELDVRDFIESGELIVSKFINSDLDIENGIITGCGDNHICYDDLTSKHYEYCEPYLKAISSDDLREDFIDLRKQDVRKIFSEGKANITFLRHTQAGYRRLIIDIHGQTNYADTQYYSSGNPNNIVECKVSDLRVTKSNYEQFKSDTAKKPIENDNNIALNLPIDQRSEKTYLNVIAALLDCVTGQFNDRNFSSETKLREFLNEKYGDYYGISKRTLAEKFADAKKSLNDEF